VCQSDTDTRQQENWGHDDKEEAGKCQLGSSIFRRSFRIFGTLGSKWAFACVLANRPRIWAKQVLQHRLSPIRRIWLQDRSNRSRNTNPSSPQMSRIYWACIEPTKSAVHERHFTVTYGVFVLRFSSTLRLRMVKGSRWVWYCVETHTWCGILN